MLKTEPFDTISGNSKLRTKFIKVLWSIDLEFFVYDIRSDESLEMINNYIRT